MDELMTDLFVGKQRQRMRALVYHHEDQWAAGQVQTGHSSHSQGTTSCQTENNDVDQRECCNVPGGAELPCNTEQEHITLNQLGKVDDILILMYH